MLPSLRFPTLLGACCGLLVTAVPAVQQGRIVAPEGPGLGAAWQDQWFQSPREVRVSRL